jgi:hypothetical protein
MIAVRVLLNLLVIPLIIDGINIPLTKDTEDYICTFDDDGRNGGDGGDGGDGRTSSNHRRNRRSRRSHGIKKSRYSYPLHHLALQL